MTIPQVSGYGNSVYPYQTYTTTQFNNWNNYGYSTPVFKGAEHKPVVQQPLNQDKVELSTEKETKSKKKDGLSTGAKWTLGLAGAAVAAYGCVVGHRMLNKPSLEKIAKNFSEIFRRDVSKEEAQKLVSEYKELLKIENTEEFCKNAFEKVKKDYGYANLNIPLIIRKKTSGCAAAWAKNTGEVIIYQDLSKSLDNYSRKSILRDLIHEFQHAKQTEISYRTSPEKLLDSMESNHPRQAIGNLLSLPEKQQKAFAEQMNMTLDDFIKSLKEEGLKEKPDILLNNPKWIFKRAEAKNRLDELFGSMPKYSKGSKEYELGMKYIEAERNYIPSSIDKVKYKENMLEADAYATGPQWSIIYNSFANPWRLF